MHQLVERLGVRLTIGVHGIPMGVPHTRPTAVTAHGTRPELIAGREPWVGRVQVPGSMINLLELRLGQAGHDAMGFAVHVPHYLAQAEYPAAAAALLDQVSAATGLLMPTASLRTAAEQTRTEIDEQVARVGGGGGGRAGSRAAVRRVRRAAAAGGDLLAGRGAGFPTADELGAELERFLADRSKGYRPGGLTTRRQAVQGRRAGSASRRGAARSGFIWDPGLPRPGALVAPEGR